MWRGLITLSLLFVYIIGIIFWFSTGVIAQSDSVFNYDGSKLTHTYTDTDGSKKTVIWTKYRGPVLQTDREINQFMWTVYLNKPQGDIEIVKLTSIETKNDYFMAISKSRVGSERGFAILAKAPTTFPVGRATTVKAGELIPFFPSFMASSTFSTMRLNELLISPDKDNTDLVKYLLDYLVNQMPPKIGGWAIQDKSQPLGTCQDKDAGTYYRSDRDFKYFSPADAGYPVVVGRPLTIDIDSSKASITLPGASNLEQDGKDLKRPVIEFTYKYWMRWSNYTRNNYYYFLPPVSSKHCNLALRLNDGWVGAHIIAVSINDVSSISGDQRSIFESHDIAKVSIDKSAYDQFMKKLNGGLKPGDSGFSSEFKTKQGPEPDELGGVKIGSGDNPSATGDGAGTKCRDSFKGFWDRLLIANAICGTLELLGGIAFFFANLAFSLLIYASGLQ